MGAPRATIDPRVVRRVVLWALGAASGVAAVPSTAQAQVAPPAEHPDLDEGIALLRQNRYGEAVLRLEAAARGEHPLAWYNLGLAYRGAGRPSQAIAAFERYLARPDANASPARLALIRAELPSLRRAMVSVQVRTTPPGAALQVDGRPQSTGDGAVWLDPGAHVLEWSAPGFQTQRRELSLQPGATAVLEIVLGPAEPPAAPPAVAVAPRVEPAHLLIDAPAEATVSIDGAPVGSGAVDRVTDVGDHDVEVRARGMEPWRRRLHVGAGSTRHTVTLRPVARSPGWVLPTAIAGGAVLVSAAIAGVAWLARGDAEPTAGTLGVFRE